MKNRKARTDKTSAGICKSLGEGGIDVLCDIMLKIYEQEKIPGEWRNSVPVPIYKEKGIFGIVEARDG